EVRDAFLHFFARLAIRRNGGDHDNHAVAREQLGDEADAADVGIAVLAAETKALREIGANDIAIQEFGFGLRVAEAFHELIRDSALPRSRHAGEPKCEALVFHARVRSRISLSRTSTVRCARPSGVKWMPHSLAASSSHHQRPARSSSPGSTA